MNNNKPDDDKHKKAVPTGRFSRMAKLGSMATGIAGGMLAEGAKQWSQGKRPKATDLLLTPGNAKRMADQLAQLRGAAMKVGQLLSMDAGDLIPPELAEILARLRSDGEAMPFSQLVQVLESNWGSGWNDQFSQFSFQPLAAASIGQVHSAQTHDGRHLALKIQYPGIRESIDSDVDNVATLLRISNLIPKGVDYRSLLEEAKRQLHEEADYQREAQYTLRYRQLLQDREEFIVPEVYEDLTTQNILAMQFVEGAPLEALQHASQDERNRAMTLLMELLMREIFQFRLVQTDPNFANYLYQADSQRLVLLDFGAARDYPAEFADGYRQVMQGAIDQDRSKVDEAVERIGFFQQYILPEQREAVVDMFMLGCEPLQQGGAYDFGQADLAARIRDVGTKLSLEQDYWHTPPADAIFLHRKLGGLYLQAAKLRAQVDVRGLFEGIT